MKRVSPYVRMALAGALGSGFIGFILTAAGIQLHARKPTTTNLTSTSISQMTGDNSLKTHLGNEIHVVQTAKSFSNKAGIPKKSVDVHRLLIQGGIHGNEIGASQFVNWLAQRYAQGLSQLNQLQSDQPVEIDFIPYANPDGQLRNTRLNAAGINLNRNYEVLWGVSRENPGQTSFSEPETRALRALFSKRQYIAAVDIHGYINWVVGPTSPARAQNLGYTVNPVYKQRYQSWSSVLEEQANLLPGYEVKTAGGLGDGGAFEDWAFWSQGAFAFCLELETVQRFIPTYSAKADDRIDLYQRYEAYLFAVFKEAIQLKQAESQTPHLADVK